LYAGCYFISNGLHTVAASTDHYTTGDDGLPISTAVVLENNDHLFFIKTGTEYYWATYGTVNVTETQGSPDLIAPYTNLSGYHIFASVEEMAAHNALVGDVGVYSMVTGYNWVYQGTTVPSDWATSYQVLETISSGGDIEADANFCHIPCYELWEHMVGSGNTVCYLKIDNGSTNLYWKLDDVMGSNAPTSPITYLGTTLSSKNFWGVINNSYDLATTTSAGLMAAADKLKLDAAYNYTHPTYTAKSIDTTGVDVLDTFTSDAAGHVTAITTRTLPDATASVDGIMTKEYASKLDGIATGANLYVHPTYTAKSVDTSGVDVLDTFTSDAAGHVTAITTRTLPSSSTTVTGVNRLATTAEGQTASSSSIASTPASDKALLDYYQGMKLYGTLALANSGTHPDGAIVLVTVTA